MLQPCCGGSGYLLRARPQLPTGFNPQVYIAAACKAWPHPANDFLWLVASLYRALVVRLAVKTGWYFHPPPSPERRQTLRTHAVWRYRASRSGAQLTQMIWIQWVHPDKPEEAPLTVALVWRHDLDVSFRISECHAQK